MRRVLGEEGRQSTGKYKSPLPEDTSKGPWRDDTGNVVNEFKKKERKESKKDVEDIHSGRSSSTGSPFLSIDLLSNITRNVCT